MKLKSTRDIVACLEQNNQLVRIADEIDPYLEMAEIQRRIYRQKGPAILFENVKGCSFPCLSNIYGTPERARLIFKNTYRSVKAVVGAKADPMSLLTTCPFHIENLLNVCGNSCS